MSRKLWPLAALSTVALIGAGCSNDSAENGNTGTGTASSGANKKLTARDKAVKFAECVRDNGVKDFPDPVNGEPLVNTYKIPSSNKPGGMAILNAAMQKCGKVLGEAAGGQG
jgi:hypothetical protein